MTAQAHVAPVKTGTPWSEEPLVFACKGQTLVGVLSRPAHGQPRIGVVIIVGGPQYRAGSHRQFVHLARRLSASGHAVLRFDVRGMGDSEGDMRSFTALDDDIAAAIDALVARQPSVQHVALWGLCDGASAALLYWRRRGDTRVAAMCLLNPWLRSEQGQARTQVRHYYLERVMQGDFWRKLLRGGVGGRAMSELLANLRRARGHGAATAGARDTRDDENFRDGMAAAWQQFPGQIMLVLSGRDYTAKEFLDGIQRESAWSGALSRAGLHRVDLPAADHTFSGPDDRAACERAVVDWLGTLCVDPVPDGARA